MSEGKMRHPLDLGGSTAPPWMRRAPGEFVEQMMPVVDVDPVRLMPTRAGQHSWMQELTAPVDLEGLRHGGLVIRPHMLAMVRVFCWVCDSTWCPEHTDGASECPGDPEGRFIPTQSEFRLWSDEQRDEWRRSL